MTKPQDPPVNSGIVWAVIAGIVVGCVVSVVFSPAGSFGGVYNNVTGDFSEGISVDGTVVIDGSGNIDAPITSTDGTFSDDLSVTDDVTISGDSTLATTTVESFTQGGLHCTLTDATGGAYTLTQAELLNCSVFKFAAGGSTQEVIALTFPATSSLTTLIPNAGDFREWIYDATALAAATTTTLTAGTGFDLLGVTTADDVIDGNEHARISCWRQADTDVSCITSELLHSD